MVQSTQKLKTVSKRAPQKDVGDDRLLVLPTGYLGFLGKRACKALGVTATAAKKTHVSELFQFVSEDDALISSPFNLKEHVDHWMQTIRPGAQKLLNKKGEEVIFQFDQVISDGTILVVASYVESGAVSEGAPLSEWIEETLVTQSPTKAKNTAAPSNNVTQIQGQVRGINAQEGVNPQVFLDMSNDLMVTCTPKGGFQSVNGRFTKMLGYDQDQLQSLSIIDIIHPDDRAQVRPVLINMFDEDAPQGQTVDFEARIVSRQGKTYPMEWRLSVTENAVYMVGQDMSKAKENEAALISQKEHLSEAQAISHMGHWTWHMGTHQIDWSDEIYRIFGVESDDFTPTIELINKKLHRRDIGRIMQAFQRAMIEKRDYEMEFSIKRPSGEDRFIKCQGRCKLDEEGEVVSLFGVMQDVTEHIESERALQSAKESVERAYSAKSQFLANMSHELRTPLNAIIGFSEMMQRQLLGPIGNEKYLDYITGIRESGEHLLDLITDILDMSKIEAGKYELICEDVNISKVIKLSVHMMEGRALDGSIKLKTNLTKADVHVTADRRAIMQVLLNLLSNAVKFTKESGEVTVSCKKVKDTIRIVVEDNGIGIPAMKLNTITNPFEQVSNQYTRDHDGSGLGLAITKELVELHGGSMKIESKVNVGTSVIITLPNK